MNSTSPSSVSTSAAAFFLLAAGCKSGNTKEAMSIDDRNKLIGSIVTMANDACKPTVAYISARPLVGYDGDDS
ncbi:hypothetical protein GUJ93_ZPchr0006g42823 [Zizania palustris]|uniref:Uncharacterized protein n=1 Tax=Zizania palustris TaxID=103762 RepID=A0A8J5W2J6_ZIZPA|nr:hypothetical protein GUJ93_ZPchr0006g42823 [Zizania palustris]